MNLAFLFADDYTESEEEEFVSFILFFLNTVKFFISYVTNYFQTLFSFTFEQGAREDDTHSPAPKINWAVNLDDDNYSEEDGTFVHPPPVSI